MAEPLSVDEKADPLAGDLPLEDPRWILLIPVQQRLKERVGSSALADIDLNQALANGAVRCHVRFAANGKREWLPSDLWIHHQFHTWSDGVLTISRRQPKPGSAIVRPIPGVLYVWKPDIDKFWLKFELPPVPEKRLETDAPAIDPPASAAPPLEPKTDAPIITSLTEARVNDGGPQRDERQSRRRDRSPGTKSVSALVVLARIYPDYAYPTRAELPDAGLWKLFVAEWDKVEGKKKLSLNLRPSPSTVLRVTGRKD